MTITVIGLAAVQGCVGDQTAPECGQPVDHTSVRDVRNTNLTGDAPVVTLGPGQQTTFTATWPAQCASAWEIQVRVPGDQTAIVVGAGVGPVPTCDGAVIGLTPIGTTL